MPEVVNWHQGDPRVVVPRVLEMWAEGHLVAFPTQLGYDLAANALAAEAVARLPGDDNRLSVAVRSPAEALDWIPGLSPLGQRLARHGWPGPLALVSGDGIGDGLASRLPEAVGRRLCSQGVVNLRMPENQVLQVLLHLWNGPVVLANVVTSANGPGDPSAAGQSLLREEDIALIVENGPPGPELPLSVVQVQGEQWHMVHEGALTAADVADMTPCRILFVCTGNTCRSPLAQALCTKLLADRLGCPPDDLPRHGFVVQSAGLSAMLGGEASPLAVAVAQELGADLSDHLSQPLTRDLLARVDHLFTMTNSHLRALLSYDLRGCPVPRLLSPQGLDVPDPIGSSPDVYRECAQQILQYLHEWLPHLHSL